MHNIMTESSLKVLKSLGMCVKTCLLTAVFEKIIRHGLLMDGHSNGKK